METTYLKTFVEVAQTGSLARAAENLLLTQPTISRQIKFLERQSKNSLLDRSGVTIKLTSTGKLFFEKALRILELEQELNLELFHFRAPNSLYFASTPTFSTLYLPQILSSFIKAHPGVTDLRISIDTPDNIIQNLVSGLFEIAVIEHCLGYDLSDFETIPLPADEMVFAAAPNIEFTAQQKTLEQFFKNTLVCHVKGSCSRILLENNLREIGQTTENFYQTIVVEDLDVTIQLLLDGNGISFISTDLIKSFVESGQLHMFRLPGFIHQRKRTLVLPAPAANFSPAKKFSDFIVGAF